MKICGVYMIKSIEIPERIYIGSSNNIRLRFQEHLSVLRHDKHSPKIQEHYNNYGEKDLLLCIIEECHYEELKNREQIYLDMYHPYFNYCPSAFSKKGSISSDIARERISNAGKNRVHGEESKIKIGNKHRGKILSSETKEKIRQHRIGKKASDETKTKMSNIRKGIKLSPDTIAKMKIGLTGQKRTPETCMKISLSKKGKTPWNKGLKMGINNNIN